MYKTKLQLCERTTFQKLRAHIVQTSCIHRAHIVQTSCAHRADIAHDVRYIPHNCAMCDTNRTTVRYKTHSYQYRYIHITKSLVIRKLRICHLQKKFSCPNSRFDTVYIFLSTVLLRYIIILYR